MKATFAMIAILCTSLRRTSAVPVEIKELMIGWPLGKRYFAHPKTNVLPFNCHLTAVICTDFSGDLAFLNDNLASIAVFDMGFIAFSDFGVMGRTLEIESRSVVPRPLTWLT
ncbi:hypothetical protein BDZ94DRAFT_1303265 [Collybia nuda]|uniref:Uncharacterized protein n=1 Tax=Collybia nuda TaxID=64659 RepID=A0A9P5YKN6_9AGAR|nr:hypothetical protein BDZ94DRAFT_1303265 [Collybia nuda]